MVADELLELLVLLVLPEPLVPLAGPVIGVALPASVCPVAAW
jgi:hypothetical protein